MSDDQLPLLPDPPRHSALTDGFSTFPSSNSKSNGKDHLNRFAPQKGCNLYWIKMNVSGSVSGQKPTAFMEKCFGRKQRRMNKILDEASGVARRGRLLAIMGSSGAGKTTLLNTLTSRNLSGLVVSGTVAIDDRRVNKWEMKEISAFVQQNDMFIGTLTAREHLRFMAKLRMGSAYTTAEQHLRVEDVIRKMGLSDCADGMIGIPNSIKGLSCGEKKRLSFASEALTEQEMGMFQVLTCPRILFCDEPTSGLDAFMAGHVVAALRDLADAGMTVVTTIHQPSSQVYSLFNDICLMACGRIIYLGPTTEVNGVFERCGYPCPDFHNPSDHFIRTLSVSNGERRQSLNTISEIREEFLKTPHGKEIRRISDNKQIADTATEDVSRRSFFNIRFPASLCQQIMALTWRSWLTVVRNPMLLKVKLIQTVICAIITGLVYFNTPITPETIISINGVLFNHVRNLNFMFQFPAVPVITMELTIVLRENSNGAYSTTSYFIGKNLAELPQYIALPTLYNVFVYWMAAYAVAALFGSTDVAMTFLPIFVIPMLAFGGFFITYDAIPSYFTWMSALSYFKYSYEGLAINEWEAVDRIPGCLNDSLLYYPNCPKTGVEVLQQISFDSTSKWFDVFVLLIMTVVIRFIAFGALLVRAYKNN
ncbi:hypothetical protein Q1695_015177 [Nippostrongylus brasiliensis]|nr:hypothetical protein Q1695_015177 [Nippostrongylus brasiliensis]